MDHLRNHKGSQTPLRGNLPTQYVSGILSMQLWVAVNYRTLRHCRQKIFTATLTLTFTLRCLYFLEYLRSKITCLVA